MTTFRQRLEGWIGADLNGRQQFKHMTDHVAMLDELQALEAALSDWISGTYGTHTHAMSDVDGLAAAINSKANLAHLHIVSDIEGLQAVLDSKLNTSAAFSGDYNDLSNKPVAFPPTVHVHAISDVAGLQTALDAKLSKTPKAAAIANTTSNASASSVTILGISVPTNASYLDLVAAHNALKDKVNTILTALRSREIIES